MLHLWNPTSTKALGQLLQLLPKALPDGSRVVSSWDHPKLWCLSEGPRELALQGTQGVTCFLQEASNKAVPMPQEGWTQTLDLGCLPSPQGQWRSQRWGSAIIHIPHTVELKSWVFLPSPPTQGLGAKYISHCTQHMRGEAKWEGMGGVGEAVPLRNMACHRQRLGGPGNPSSPSAAGMKDGFNKHLISFFCAEALGEAGSPGTGHHGVTPSQGQVHREQTESRRAVMLSCRGERDQGVESGAERDRLISSVGIMQADLIPASALAMGTKFCVPLPERHGPGLSSRHRAELPSGTSRQQWCQHSIFLLLEPVAS